MRSDPRQAGNEIVYKTSKLTLNIWISRSPVTTVALLTEFVLLMGKETTLERADFALQLFMFVTMEKERRMFIIFCLSIFCQLLSPQFKQGQAEHVQTIKAQTTRPRRQLFLI